MIKQFSEKLNKLSPGAKSSIAFALASAVSAGVSYFTTPIFSRTLSSEEYGTVSVFLTWQAIFAIIAMFSLNYGVFNNGMMDYKEERDSYSYSLLCLSNIITICTAILIAIFQVLFPGVLKIEPKYLAIMFAVFMVHPAYNFWLARQRYEYNYKPVIKVSIIIAILGPLVSLACVLLFEKNRVDGRIFGLECTMFLVYIVFYIFLGKKAGWKCKRSFWKEAFLFNLPLLPHYLSVYLLSSSDRIMISEIINKSATSYYSIAYTIASFGIIVWTAINGSLVPFTYEKCKNQDYKSLRDMVNPILVVIATCCFLIILIAPEVMVFLGPSEYKSSVVVVPPIVGGIFFQVHYSLYANVLYYYRKPQWVMVASITAASVNIITNAIFISRFGYVAAGYTTLFCYLIQAIIDCIAMKKVAQSFVYDIRFIILLSIIVSIASVFGPLLYSYVLLRYLLILTVIIVVFLKRKTLLSSFSYLIKNRR